MRYALRVTLGAIVLLVAQQSLAWAVWTAPLSEWAIATPYGAPCQSGTHRGVDLAASAGAHVMTPCAGAVVFAGQVPADGGGTCGAVTIQTDEGLRVSMLPLAELWVSQGCEVGAGDQLGTLAATGDDSSPSPHLHIGLRRGEVYLDPTSLLPPVAAAPIAVSSPPPPPASPTAPAAGSGSGGGVICTPAGSVADQAATPAAQPGVAGSPHAVAGATNRPRSMSRQLLIDAGVPAPSALGPDLSPAPGRFRAGAVGSVAQPWISAMLLAGMLAAAAGIAAPKLAAVRSR